MWLDGSVGLQQHTHAKPGSGLKIESPTVNMAFSTPTVSSNNNRMRARCLPWNTSGLFTLNSLAQCSGELLSSGATGPVQKSGRPARMRCRRTSLQTVSHMASQDAPDVMTTPGS
jgi:hypothetical protein